MSRLRQPPQGTSEGRPCSRSPKKLPASPAGSCVARDGAKLVLSQPAAQRKENLTLRAEISTTKSVFFLDL